MSVELRVVLMDGLAVMMKEPALVVLQMVLMHYMLRIL